MKWNFEEGVILNINKPEDWTSFDVVKKIRNSLKVKKVGHAGTLDPFATGVLIICTGKATKKVNRLMNLEKEYIATILLGKRSDTYDRTGQIETVTEDVSHITREQIEEALKKYIGVFEQRIPPYSAAKKGGKRLYELARKGTLVENLTKQVEIREIEILDFTPPILKIRLRCGKGTYVRTLADDLGRDLGTGALLAELQRTKVGPYSVDGAWTIEQFLKQVQKEKSQEN
jgi:tRNA pseudouridine55 synthase